MSMNIFVRLTSHAPQLKDVHVLNVLPFSHLAKSFCFALAFHKQLWNYQLKLHQEVDLKDCETYMSILYVHIYIYMYLNPRRGRGGNIEGEKGVIKQPLLFFLSKITTHWRGSKVY